MGIAPTFFVSLEAIEDSPQANTIHLNELINVYDGDTFRANLEGDFQSVCGENMGTRVNGLDTPEKKT